MVRQTAFLVIVLGVLAAPQAAWSGEKEEARKHYDRAVELVDDGQLEGAIVEFQRSYDLTRHFAVLYNIGQVFVSLARPVEAVDAYERYLADGGKKVPAARRSEVEKEIARQKARIATLEIRALPQGASLRLDGNEIGKAPISAPVRVGVGKHVIAASAEGYDSAEKEVTVAGEDHKAVELVLAKRVVETPALPPAAQVASAQPVTVTVVTPAQLPPEPRVAAEPIAKPMSNVRLLGILTGVVGVAGIAAGGGCWWVGMTRNDESKDNWSTNPDKAQSLRGEAQDFLTAGNTLFYAGGALVVLGVVLYFVGASDDHPATSSTHAHLMPTLGRGFAGLTAGGIW
ncbi:MAG: PEGA domain-containing protein [Polyangia bacterium]